VENFGILVGTIIVTSDETSKDFTFIWGDVNGNDGVTGADANDILVKLAGGADKVGSADYAIGGEVISGIIWGDVNGNDGVTGADANDILVKLAGGADKVGSADYAIAEEVTIKIPNAK
jgi:hypothetical protein